MDEQYMKRAIELAYKGKNRVSPNPIVGAVVVKEGKIIGEGYHAYYGGPHAEVMALETVEDASGATLYVTLEPCAHYGKTPPCVDLVIRKNIKRVVIGMIDPNPLVAGKSTQKLKSHGIEVKVGVLEAECMNMNRAFIKHITTGRPYVMMKMAMSLDGKIATASGESKWITGERARAHVQTLRSQVDAIMVGIGTALKDDPRLTCRIEGGHKPLRIVVDSQLRLPLTAHVVTTVDEAPTLIATTHLAPKEKIAALQAQGVQVRVCAQKDGHVDLDDLMVYLGQNHIGQVLLEGGGALNDSALRNGIVDAVQVYIAPCLIGGSQAKTPVEGQGIADLKARIKLENLQFAQVGEDFYITGDVIKEGE